MNEVSSARLDAVTLAVLKGRLEQIADEMDATLYRSAFNPIIAEARDACHGVYDAITGDTPCSYTHLTLPTNLPRESQEGGVGGTKVNWF